MKRDPIIALVEAWAWHDEVLNRLSDAEWDAQPEHPSMLRCIELWEQLQAMEPTSTMGRIAKAGLAVVREGPALAVVALAA